MIILGSLSYAIAGCNRFPLLLLSLTLKKFKNMRHFLLPLLFLAVAACNSSGDKKDNADTTTTQTGHEGMDHKMPESGGVPALPAIPEGAKVFFKNLQNNATIASPFKMEMGTEIMKVDTAGPVVAGSGHHHLIIDGPDSLAAGSVVPADSLNIHFGKGQTEYELKLSPGKHKLTLQMADGLHRSYGGRLSATVTVNVKK
jgi:Domain of unknown function (DUF4399)